MKIFPVLIIILSLIGNLLGLIVFIKKKSRLENKIGPIIIYKYLFTYGIINTYSIIILYLQSFGIYLETISKSNCQVMVYFWYVTASILPMILVYISVERFISIKYPEKRSVLNKNLIQHCFIIVLVIYNLLANIWIPFNCILIDKRNSTLLKYISNYNPNDNRECLRANKNLFYLTTLNTKIIPYSLMITFTILLIVSIFKSRNRVISNYTNIQNETFQKDVKFAFSSLSLNIIFILFNLPASIVLISGNNYHYLFLIFLYLYLFSFSIHFYLLLIFNSLLFSDNNNNNNNNYIRSFNINLINDPNVKETNV